MGSWDPAAFGEWGPVLKIGVMVQYWSSSKMNKMGPGTQRPLEMRSWLENCCKKIEIFTLMQTLLLLSFSKSTFNITGLFFIFVLRSCLHFISCAEGYFCMCIMEGTICSDRWSSNAKYWMSCPLATLVYFCCLYFITNLSFLIL